MNPFEGELAWELSKIAGVSMGTQSISISSGMPRLRWLFGRLKSRWSATRSQAAKMADAHAPILFHVCHPKFVSYLRPIVRNFDRGDYAYLVSTDATLVSEIERLGEPCLFWPRHLGLRSAMLGSTLWSYQNLCEAADNILDAIRFYRPKCVVVVEGNAPLDSITAEVCKQLDVSCLCVQQGWSPVVHNGFRNMSFDEMFVWGEELVRVLEPYNPHQHFTVTGSHALQGNGSHDIGSHQQRISFFLQAPCPLLGANGYAEFIDLIVRCATSHPEVQFLVREHPSYPLPATLSAKMQLENVCLSAGSGEPLADVIGGSSIVVSVFSTVLLEAISLGTVPLICNIGSLPNYEPDLARLGAAIEVKSMADACQMIERVIRDPDCLEPFKKKLPSVSARYFKKGDAAAMISDKIKSAARISVSGQSR